MPEEKMKTNLKVRKTKEEKVSIGIPGLDGMLGGGIPKNHAVLVLGFCGTGKTTAAMQFIWEGLKHNESTVIISLEQSKESLIRTAAKYNWDFAQYIKNKKLAVVKLDPTDLKNTVTIIKKELPKILKMLEAQRIVVDPLSLFEMMFENVGERRIRLFELCSLIKSSGATAVYTSETSSQHQETDWLSMRWMV